MTQTKAKGFQSVFDEHQEFYDEQIRSSITAPKCHNLLDRTVTCNINTHHYYIIIF
ncbi:hypothetical protein LINPERPRIM_LOCUS27547 [Linum perenne]